jgi:hypothetical protein
MATKKRGRKKPGGARKTGSAFRNAAEGIRKALGPQIGDAYGIGLTVLAILCALGVWFHNAGPMFSSPTSRTPCSPCGRDPTARGSSSDSV